MKKILFLLVLTGGSIVANQPYQKTIDWFKGNIDEKNSINSIHAEQIKKESIEILQHPKIVSALKTLDEVRELKDNGEGAKLLDKQAELFESYPEAIAMVGKYYGACLKRRASIEKDNMQGWDNAHKYCRNELKLFLVELYTLLQAPELPQKNQKEQNSTMKEK